jgi:hypothetical protein
MTPVQKKRPQNIPKARDFDMYLFYFFFVELNFKHSY